MAAPPEVPPLPRPLAPLLILLLAMPAAAAPVPKGIKKNSTPDGTWKLVEFWSNGQKGTAQGMTSVWVLEGEAFYVGPKQKSSYWQLTIPDPNNPKVRRFTYGRTGTSSYPAAVEVDGDTLRFAYGSSGTVSVTEAKPAANVYYYEFTRVTGDATTDTAPAIDDLPRKRGG